MDAKILIPVRYAAWLSGDLGDRIEASLQSALGPVPALRMTRMPRGFLIEADEEPGPLVELVQRAAQELERAVSDQYPVFHHEMGPVWTGTLQVVFSEVS